MKKVTIILASMLASVTFAQETEAPASTPLEISGSADLYYNYDFSGTKNIGTSFATDQNSVSLGMIDIALKKSTGKASFVGEVSFGPRGQWQSIPNVIGGSDEISPSSFNIQNLYATYAVSDKLTLTAGYMGTFIGYEVISPVANFHYSTSYLFTNGPFQNAGVKANYAISKKVGLMVGAFNDYWNNYQANQTTKNGLNAVGAQLSVMPTDKISAYLNFLGGSDSGNIVDLTATFQLTEKFKLGLNAADYDSGNNNMMMGNTYNYTGVALYPSYAFSKSFGLGLRGEYFEYENTVSSTEWNVAALTFSANYKVGGLTVIPEFRLDNGSKNMFKDSDKADTKSAAQATIALVYGF